MATMNVEVVSAERTVWSGQASEVYGRSLDGEIGILPGHQPALLALDIAPVKIRTEAGDEQRVAVHHGFLYYRGDQLVVLADIAELPGEIDVERAEQRRREIEQQRADFEEAYVEASVRKQALRLDVAGRR